MKPWMERLWANMNAMPGPVWVFGAWSVYRVVLLMFFIPGWVSLLLQSGFQLKTGCLYILSVLFILLPLLVLWSLIWQKRFAMSLVCWYVLLRIVRIFVMTFVPIFVKPGPLFRNMSSEWLYSLGNMLLAFAVWFAFLLYMERSEIFQQLFPPENRRRIPWWIIVAMAGVILIAN